MRITDTSPGYDLPDDDTTGVPAGRVARLLAYVTGAALIVGVGGGTAIGAAVTPVRTEIVALADTCARTIEYADELIDVYRELDVLSESAQDWDARFRDTYGVGSRRDVMDVLDHADAVRQRADEVDADRAVVERDLRDARNQCLTDVEALERDGGVSR